jgi:short-subunit dehydrogenase
MKALCASLSLSGLIEKRHKFWPSKNYLSLEQPVPKTSFLNQVAIVTGASSGIGRATALELARKGAHTALASRNTSALEEVANEVRAFGREALVVTTDVTRREEVECLVEKVASRWGSIDLVIANAGQYIRTPVTELTVETVERSLQINFYGALYFVLAALPHLLAQKSGHIVFVSTMDAKIAIPPDAPYIIAKFALSGFADVLRQELYGTGVSVSAIFPGRVDTPMIEDLQVPFVSAKISPEAVARAIVRAIDRRQAEVIIPPQATLLYYLKVFSPKLGDWIIRTFRLEGW